jgi:hypothetical protein
VVKKTFYLNNNVSRDCKIKNYYTITLESDELYKDSTSLKKTCREIYGIITNGKEPMEKFFKYKLIEFDPQHIGWPMLKADYHGIFYLDVRNKILTFSDLRCFSRVPF